MIVRVLTNRPEKYAYLEKYYRGTAEIQYTAADDLVSVGNAVDDDIIIADPELMGGNYFAGTMMKRRNVQRKPFIISEPGRVKGLTRELKAAGLEAGGVSITGEAGSGNMEPDSQDAQIRQSGRPSFRHVVGIVELNAGADAGFLTMLLAEELASESLRDGSLVTVFAPDCDYFYYALSLGKKYEPNGFRALDEVGENPEKDSAGRMEINVSEGISWAVGSGRIREKIENCSEAWTRCLERLEGNYLLCFLKIPETDRERELFRAVVDALIVVADSLPSSMLAGRKNLEAVRGLGIPLIYVVNHTTDSVKKDLILDYMDTDHVVFVPAVNPASVCEAEYLEENPYRIDQIRKQTMTPVCSIIEQIRKNMNHPEKT